MTENITLQIGGESFEVKKDVLCKYSDYFRAMFSGNYIEDQKKEISIDMLEASTMSIILQYIDNGSIDMCQYSLSTIGDVAAAADFLQITDLSKQIEHTLEKIELCESNWMDVMAIAERFSYLKIEQLSAAFGLYSFKRMKPEHLLTIDKLAWYLSHPYLDTQSELDVFKFGLQWVVNNEADVDALLIVLASLDYKRLTNQDICEIINNMRERTYDDSLPAKVVECLSELSNKGLEISDTVMIEQKSDLSDKFTERVFTEAVEVVKASTSRLLSYTPVNNQGFKGAPSYVEPDNCIRTFNVDTGFEMWLKRPEKAWRATSWGLMKLVVLYKEFANVNNINCLGNSYTWKVKVYDTLKKEWDIHGVDIPLMDEYCGLVVVNDSLYIDGLSFDREDDDRWTRKSVIYDLKQKTYREIAELPEPVTTIAICAHNGTVYVALEDYIYCHEDSGPFGVWRPVLKTKTQYRCIASYRGYIYYIHHDTNDLHRFRPDVDMESEKVMSFPGYTFSLTNVGNRLLIMTEKIEDIFFCRTLLVERDENKKETKVVHEGTTKKLASTMCNQSCALVLTVPPLCKQLNQYFNTYLPTYETKCKTINKYA